MHEGGAGMHEGGRVCRRDVLLALLLRKHMKVLRGNMCFSILLIFADFRFFVFPLFQCETQNAQPTA